MAADTSTNTLKLVTQEESWAQEVDESIVEMLAEMLERAKKGEFEGFAFCAACRDGATLTAHSKVDSAAILIAAVARLQHRLLLI